MRLVLASQSPRRRDLLKDAGYCFEVIPADDSAEDQRRDGETPVEYVRRLARQKAENVAGKIAAGLIIGCDTIVLSREEILGKPVDREDARRMLEQLRGTRHFVITGICLWTRPDDIVDLRDDSTTLFLRNISDEEIERYLDTNLWVGKAGGFGYQDRNDWLRIESGSESNVVGLPMELLAEMLDRAGYTSASES